MKNSNTIHSKISRVLIITTLVLINVGCDQISKDVVRDNIRKHEIINVVKHNFLLMKVENKGAVMGLGSTLAPEMKIILLQIVPALVLLFLFLIILFNTKFSKIGVIGICFIIGGGVGNIYDRILYGAVTDFMYMELGFLKTGIFNMADVSVVIGTLLIFIELVMDRSNQKNHTYSVK